MKLGRVIASTVAALGACAVSAACGGADGARSAAPDLTAAPTHVRWSPYQGVQLPSADQGPTKPDPTVALGFAHVPAGAGLAAAVHSLRVSLAPDDQWARVVSVEVVPGKERDDFATNRVQVTVSGPADPKYAPRLRGYRITSFAADHADVDVYTSYSDRSLAVDHASVAWSAQDWRLRLPSALSTRRPVDPIGSLPRDMVKLEAPGT